jgi:hypothetical protein
MYQERAAAGLDKCGGCAILQVKVRSGMQRMKREEKVVVERLPYGGYAVTLPDGTKLVGGAASTVIALTAAIFREEARDA